MALETFSDLGEARAAVLAVKENTRLPVLCTMSFERDGRTFTGCSVSAMALTLGGLGVDGLGVNCSLGPAELAGVVEELVRWSIVPVIVKPNAGLPRPGTGAYYLSPEDFAAAMTPLAKAGARLLGGCCGTTPEYIALLKKSLAGLVPAGIVSEIPPAVCSPTRTVVLDRPRVIGERINPTGKKLFKQALLRGDMDYILTQGISQQEAGADILDVNVGLPGISEAEAMTRAVKALQGVVNTPLQIDSGDPEALEAGLRVYAGKAIVNSVTGEAASLARVLPLARKYGAAVVGLTLDENGIPPTAEGRLDIARRIVAAAEAAGIPRRDVYIDCLTLTASAAESAPMETVRALALVKEDLGVKTVLGVSNVSFGLPRRDLVNRHFLALALGGGLDLAILNPGAEEMMAAVRVHALLTGDDRDAGTYTACYGGSPREAAPPPPVAGDPVSALEEAVERGLKEEAARLAGVLPGDSDWAALISGALIPPLDRVGAAFEAGTLFLPQLIQSAGAAQAAFEVLRGRMDKGAAPPESRGTIVLATVKGDIHDIGKNIVKLLLENYGFTVVDLGKDVSPDRILQSTREQNAPLVALSALMTTTLGSMAETIALLRRAGLPCKVMVGGAVLTADYAASIGADFYAKDARQGVRIAQEVFGR